MTVVRSSFRSGVCSNGGALSSIGVSWSIYNSVFTGNRAIGRGANPARPNTPGGGSGDLLAITRLGESGKNVFAEESYLLDEIGQAGHFEVRPSFEREGVGE